MIIALHQKNELVGWQKVTQADLISNVWTDFDREWIDEMLMHGEQVLTVGDCMYEVLL